MEERSGLLPLAVCSSSEVQLLQYFPRAFPGDPDLRGLCKVCVVTLSMRELLGIRAGVGHVPTASRCSVEWKSIWKYFHHLKTCSN